MRDIPSRIALSHGVYMLQKSLQALAIAALLTTFSSARAEAAAPLTKEACLTQLTTDPSGPRLDERSLRIGTIIFGEPVFQGMTPDYLCDRELRRLSDIARVEHEKERLETIVAEATTAKEGAESELRSVRSDPIIANAYWLLIGTILFGSVTALTLFNLIVWKPSKDWRRRIKEKRNRSRKIGRISSEQHPIFAWLDRF